jgi:asparagine synthase (glutamine-hydrolysing)
MPGIVGLISKMPREQAEAQLRQMTEAIRHETFYSCGMWSDPVQGVYVGWTTRKGSFADGMPLRNENGEITLFFSGEEFPEPNLIAKLKEHGHAIESGSASYLVHRYESEPDFPKGLNGRFHGLIVDTAQKTAMLFNDRFGLQRLYYYETEDAFYFAAEAKAILKVRPELRSMEARGLGEFIACGCVLENRTLFSGLHVLPPGSAWTFRNAALEKKAAYFDPREWEEQELLDAEGYYASLKGFFEQRLAPYFNGLERIGVSLTGGLDTRIIMAWHKAQAGSMPCYTFGSMYRDNQDVKLARRVAKICGQPYEVIVTDKEFLSQFPHYAERSIYLSDGCVDTSRSPDLYVNEKAREIAPVRMVGTYGSEMMMRAVMFKASEPMAGLFREEVAREVRAGKETFDASRKCHPVTFAAFRQSPWHHYGVLHLEQTQVGVRTPYLDNNLVKAVYKSPGPLEMNMQARLRLVREADENLAKLPTDLGFGGSSNAVARALLKFTFKAEYAYDYGMPQWVAQVDHAFTPFHLERIWLGRHKVWHFRLWYRDLLANYVREMLLDSRSLSRPYVEPAMVRTVVEGHTKGNRNYTTEIHRLLTLELTHRLFVDSN